MDSDLQAAIFALGDHVRYVAFGDGQEVRTHQREGLTGASEPRSDFFEELLVNPTLLRLAGQRGDLDCGGLRHVIVGYGNFNQVVLPLSGTAHVSVCVDLAADAGHVAAQVAALLARH